MLSIFSTPVFQILLEELESEFGNRTQYDGSNSVVTLVCGSQQAALSGYPSSGLQSKSGGWEPIIHLFAQKQVNTFVIYECVYEYKTNWLKKQEKEMSFKILAYVNSLQEAVDYMTSNF
jgi:hypothetical protein